MYLSVASNLRCFLFVCFFCPFWNLVIAGCVILVDLTIAGCTISVLVVVLSPVALFQGPFTPVYDLNGLLTMLLPDFNEPVSNIAVYVISMASLLQPVALFPWPFTAASCTIISDLLLWLVEGGVTLRPHYYGHCVISVGNLLCCLPDFNDQFRKIARYVI